MIAIRPVSDLQNKLTEIEEIVQQGEPVFLTKNGYGSMVVLSVEQYSALLDRAAEQSADAGKPEDGAPHAAPAPAEEDADEDAGKPEDGAPNTASSPAEEDADEDAGKPEDGAPNAAPAPAEEDVVQPEDGAPHAAPAPAGEDADEASDGARIHLKSHAPWCKPESPTLYVRKIHGFWTVMTEEQAASYWEQNGEPEDQEDEEDFWDEML